MLAHLLHDVCYCHDVVSNAAHKGSKNFAHDHELTFFINHNFEKLTIKFKTKGLPRLFK